MVSVPAIVACCSKAGLAIIRTLGGRGIPVVGLGYGGGRIGLASRFLRARSHCPDPAEDEAAFVDFLVSLAARWEGAVLFPSDDASLVALSRHKARLSARRFRVVAEDWSLVRALIEKHRTYAIAERAGVPCPRLIVVRNPDEGARAIEESAGYGGELTLCEFIPGDDRCGANYNSFAVRGRVVQEFTARKIRPKPPAIGFPTAVESVLLPEVIASGRRMIGALRYDGFSCAEFKRDPRDGIYKLMEVNARHNSSGRLAVACGIDFPWLSYRAALGDPVPGAPQEQKQGIHWIDEERDVRGAVAALGNGLHAAREYLAPYAGARVFVVASASDPAPSSWSSR